MQSDPIQQEAKVLRALKRLEKMWPDHLELYVGDGAVYVMRVGDDGKTRMGPNGSPDPDAIVESFSIRSDGGGW